MRRTVPIGLLVCLTWAGTARPQEAAPPPDFPAAALVPQAAGTPPPVEGAGRLLVSPMSVNDPQEVRLLGLREELARTAEELRHSAGQGPAGQGNPELERLRKQMELLQKQIEVLQKLVDLLREQQMRQPPPAAAVSDLQTQTAALDARSKRAAQRDRELAGAVDDLREHIDAQERAGPSLPANLKELFLPTHPNESPLSVYGVLAFGYVKENGRPGGFRFGEFSPQFLLTLNDRFLLEGEITVGPNGSTSLGRAQVDYLVNDHLTLVGGLFESPIGFFNERLNHPWFNKFPDTAVFFRQVSPGDLDLLGLQARGSFYLGCTPVKLEYNAYVSNGLNTSAASPALTDVANLEGLENTFATVNNDLATGGRVGLWVPALGLTGGVSLFRNGSYLRNFGDGIRLIQFDAGWRQGNWDVRCEYARMRQHAESVIGNNIHREGLFAQVSYRPYDCHCDLIQRAEIAFRYSYAWFRGIDPTALDLSAFDSRVDAPINRNQYTIGLNYYFYPSLVLKFAYEFNQEIGPLHFDDNVFMAQLAWGF